MDPTEWRLIIGRLNASYPGQEPIGPETAAEWFAEVGHLDAGEVWLAIRRLRVEQRWRPNLAEILTAAKLHRVEMATRARTQQLRRALGGRGVPPPPEFKQAFRLLCEGKTP